MHQLAVSSSESGNGCDLGIREQFVPLFDEGQLDEAAGGGESRH